MNTLALRCIKILKLFWTCKKGTTAIEYALIMGLVFLAIIGAVSGLGQTVANTFYNKIASVL